MRLSLLLYWEEGAEKLVENYVDPLPNCVCVRARPPRLDRGWRRERICLLSRCSSSSWPKTRSLGLAGSRASAG